MKKFIVLLLVFSMLFCTAGCSKEAVSSIESQGNVSESGDKVVDFYVEYDSDNKRHLLLFGLEKADGTYFSSDGIASLTITDYADAVLFQSSIIFSADHFSEWTNPSWDSAKLLCSIYIEDAVLSGNAANSKFLALEITLNDERYLSAGSVKVTHPLDEDASNRPYPNKNVDNNGLGNTSDNQNVFNPIDDGSDSPSTQDDSPPRPPSFTEQMKFEALSWGAPYEKFGRQLVWHDEFGGSSLDSNKWGFNETMWNSNHEHVNDSKHVRVEDGNLHLQIWKSSKDGKTYSMPSGIATTNTMLFRYGYLEMRAKVPYRKGAWPSFWCTSNTPLQTAKNRMEVDIMEGWSSTDGFSANLHKWATNGSSHAAIPSGGVWPNLNYTFKNPANLNKEYHTYGFEWDTKKMSFYVDDVKFATIDIASEKNNFGVEDIPEMDMFHDWLRIIINNECFAPGDKHASANTVLSDSDPLPIDYYIDYVRLYQSEKNGEIFKTKDEIAAVVAKR